MAGVFSGCDDRFYQSCRHAWAIDPGYTTGKVLYNLYYVLNHYWGASEQVNGTSGFKAIAEFSRTGHLMQVSGKPGAQRQVGTAKTGRGPDT